MKKICLLAAAAAGAILLTAGCSGIFLKPEPIEIGGAAEGKTAKVRLVDIQFRDTIAPPSPEGHFTYAKCGGKDAVYLDLILDVTNQKDKAAPLSKLIEISVKVDGKKYGRSFEKVETDDGADFRTDMIKPRETVRVQHGVEVPVSGGEYQVSMEVGDKRCGVAFNRLEGPPGQNTAAFGEKFQAGGLTLEFNRARCLEKIETGKYADVESSVVEYKVYRPETAGNIYLDLSGSLWNQTGEALELAQRDCKLFAVAENGQTFEGFLLADKGMDSDGTIKLEPGESVGIHAAAEIPEEWSGRLEDAVLYRDRQYYHFGSRLQEALDYSGQLPDRQETVQAGEVKAGVYTNRELGFSVEFPQDWTVYPPEETLRLMEEESPEKVRIEQKDWDIGYLALARSGKTEGDAAAAEILVQTQPAEALSGRAPADYLEDRILGGQSGFGDSASVILDGGGAQTIKAGGREMGFASGSVSYTDVIYPFNQVNARVAYSLFVYKDRAVLAQLMSGDEEEFKKGEAALKGITFSQ